jgi:signal transduction histidine kinase
MPSSRPAKKPRPWSISGRPIALAMLVVVICFGASLWLSHVRLAAVEEQLEDITQNALPSLEDLADLRRALREVFVSAYQFADMPRKEKARGELNEARVRLHKAFENYFEDPFFPQELDLALDARQRLAWLEHAIDRSIAIVDAHPDSEGELALRDLLLPEIARFDGAIQQLVEVNAEAMRERADQIMRLRREAATFAAVFGALSTGAAVIAGLLVFRAMRKAARVVRDQNAMLAERARELDAFSGRVAHDLRNPLSAIATIADLGRGDSGGTPQTRALFGRLDRQVARSSAIIDGLLAFAKSGARPSLGERAEVKAVVESVIADVRPLAEAASASLDTAAVGELRVACSPPMLMSVLQNLLVNAAKYIAEGGPIRRISVRAFRLKDRVRIEIEDTGPGIPAGKEREIFEPHVRLAQTRLPGTGLGLATAKRIVDAYGGRIGVTSAHGEGSCFWVELPQA